MENARTTIWLMAAVLAFVVTPALAEPTVDDFWIYFDQDGFADGDGSGFNDGTGWQGTPWYDIGGSYNQWFYDDPPDPTRWKEITYDISIETTVESLVTVALNWSTLAYPETGPDGPPPLPPLTPGWIVHEVIFNGYITESVNIDGTFIIPDYNPEWVSIDIIGSGPEYTYVHGIITHECIPAPGAIVLGSIGVGLVGWLRRRRTL